MTTIEARCIFYHILRLLGIPALEDKIVQQVARMLLEPIYE